MSEDEDYLEGFEGMTKSERIQAIMVSQAEALQTLADFFSECVDEEFRSTGDNTQASITFTAEDWTSYIETLKSSANVFVQTAAFFKLNSE